jgi:transposase ISL3 family protein
VPCLPEVSAGRACKAHDFAAVTWQHLNFFQGKCFITARVPRVDCETHGIKRVVVPWAQPGRRFTLLFEQAAIVLVREMPLLAAARFIGITDKRLWRIVGHYVHRAVAALDLRHGGEPTTVAEVVCDMSPASSIFEDRFDIVEKLRAAEPYFSGSDTGELCEMLWADCRRLHAMAG